MNIVEGEHDPTFWLMTIATLILVILSLSYLMPYITGLIQKGICP